MKKPREIHAVALCGSLRDVSKTRVALNEALDAARGEGATTELIDLRSYRLPSLYDDVPEKEIDAEKLRREVDKADAIILGTPNYHGSYSGSLKNALDYLGRDEFSGKIVGLLEVAGGSFPGPAIHHLRQVCRTLNAWTLPTEVAIPNSRSTVTQDEIVDDEITERVRKLGKEIVRYAGVEDYPEKKSKMMESASAD